jgi:hypothetical protein
MQAVRQIRLIAVLCAALAAAALASCGSGDDDNVREALRSTFIGDKNVNSGRVRLNATARLEGLPGTIRIELAGPFNERERSIAQTGKIPEADLDLRVSGIGQSVETGVISTGDEVFAKYRGRYYRLPQRTFNRLKRLSEQGQRGENRGEANFGVLGVNPRRWLADPENEGTEEVAGAETVHLSSKVDVRALVDDLDRLLRRAGELNLGQQQQQLPPGLPPAVRDVIARSIKEARLDFYTGEDDNVLRKLEAHLEFDVPANLQQQAGQVRGGELDLTYELTDVNEPQTITPPRDARPFSELQRQLRSTALGGALGAGGQATTPGSGGFIEPGGSRTQPRVPRAKAQRYLRCVREAGLSRAKLRACADVLR